MKEFPISYLICYFHQNTNVPFFVLFLFFDGQYIERFLHKYIVYLQ
jgi:hypothetical protein